MEMLIGREYNKYATWSDAEKDNINVVEEYVLTRIEQRRNSIPLTEYRVYRVHSIMNELLAIFFDEREARKYLASKKGI